MRTVIAGGRVLAPDAGTRSLDIVIDDGTVVEFRPHQPTAGDDNVVDARGLIVLPGLVNAHTHSYGQLARMPFADSWLEPWMPRAMASWRGASPEAFALAATLNAADARRRGITTMVDHATLNPAALEAVIDAYDRSGLRVLLALQVSDLPFARWVPGTGLAAGVAERIAAADPFPVRSCSEVLELVERAVERLAGHPRISVLVGPAAPERCSDELLTGLGTLAEVHQLPVHTHLLEVASQRVWGDLVARLDHHGLLGATTTVAHAVHVDEHDRSQLAAAGTGVVLNPLSNAALGCSRVAPATELRRAGAALGVGTDGFNCGGGQDLLGSARLAMVLERGQLDPGDWMTLRDAWRLATTGLAAPLGAPQLGRVEVGSPADLLLVDPDGAGWLDLDDPASEAVLGGFGAGLRSVLVAGDPVPDTTSADVMTTARAEAADLRRANSPFEDELDVELVPALIELCRSSAALTSPRHEEPCPSPT